MSRIDTLRAMLEQDPANTFASYGLATELKNMGDLEGAVYQFERLLQTNGRYSAAYFHGGQTLEKLGRIAEAKDWYARGLEATVAANDAHAQAEMQAALDQLS